VSVVRPTDIALSMRRLKCWRIFSREQIGWSRLFAVLNGKADVAVRRNSISQTPDWPPIPRGPDFRAPKADPRFRRKNRAVIIFHVSELPPPQPGDVLIFARRRPSRNLPGRRRKDGNDGGGENGFYGGKNTQARPSGDVCGKKSFENLLCQPVCLV